MKTCGGGQVGGPRSSSEKAQGRLGFRGWDLGSRGLLKKRFRHVSTPTLARDRQGLRGFKRGGGLSLPT